MTVYTCIYWIEAAAELEKGICVRQRSHFCPKLTLLNVELGMRRLWQITITDIFLVKFAVSQCYLHIKWMQNLQHL